MCMECNSKNLRNRNRRLSQSEFDFASGNSPPPSKPTLASAYPNIAKEWDSEKNKDLTPEEVPPKSHKRAWWKCPKGHSYETYIFSRTSNVPSNCPYCAGQKPIKGETDLATRIPQILAEWDDSKNALGPDEYTAFSGQKVWWICPDCHTSYLARIVNRTANGTGCPCCYGQKVVAGRNSLHDYFPAIAVEWDRLRNELTPDQVTAGSNKKAWFICPLGHSYDMIIKNRTIKGEGCPYCSGHRVLVGFNDLVTTHPHIAAEWDTDRNGQKNPYQYTHGSDEIVWWRCPFGNHSYQTTISSRTCHGQGCPCSCGRKVFAGHNDLQSMYPSIVAGWDHERNEKTSDQFTAYSNEEVWWRCPLGHSYRARIDNHTLKNDGCPYCTNRELLIGFNDLLTLLPNVINQWDHLRNSVGPDQVLATVNAEAWLFCPAQHSYKASINASTGEISTCPFCNNRELLIGLNDLQTVFPGILDLWDYKNNPLHPDQIVAKANVKAFLLCSKGHSYGATISASTGEISTCPYCNNRKLLTGFNDLQTVFPSILNLWDYENNLLRPDQIIAKAIVKAFLLCSKKHSYEATINAGTGDISTCPYCNNRELLTGFNDLLTVFPEINEQWDTTKNKTGPDLIHATAEVKAYLLCPNGHSYRAIIKPRERENSTCPYCNHKLPVIGESDLLTKHPELKDRWDYSENAKPPQLYFPESRSRKSWLCEKKHSFKAPIHKMAMRFRCPECVKEQKKARRK